MTKNLKADPGVMGPHTHEAHDSERQNNPIGVFDSGVGGLTVVSELVSQIPRENVVYFGDTAHLPYGTKSAATILALSKKNVELLLRYKVKLIIVACHSATSVGEDILRNESRVPIVGVITPGIDQACRVTKNCRIGVIGTPATIASGSYPKAIKKKKTDVEVFCQAAGLFVPFVEEGWARHKLTRSVVEEYLEPLMKHDIDTPILGCTHYPLLMPLIQKVVGANVRIIDSAYETVRCVKSFLIENRLAREIGSPDYQFIVSDDPEKFQKLGRMFLKSEIPLVKHVSC